MSRVFAFIDGFNLYHALVHRQDFARFRWLDLRSLVAALIPKNDFIVEVLYFTAYATWNQDKWARHRTYVRALESRGVKTVFGEFKRKDKKCPKCGQPYSTFEEKQTDVNIAIELFRTSVDDKFDKALIISGDSDLIPAITAVKKLFPAKRIGIAIPPGRRAESLKQVADFHMKLKPKHLERNLFPDIIDLGGGQKLVRPENWK